jgi:hypothetical protein
VGVRSEMPVLLGKEGDRDDAACAAASRKEFLSVIRTLEHAAKALSGTVGLASQPRETAGVLAAPAHGLVIELRAQPSDAMAVRDS